MAGRIPGARVEIIAGAGHLPPLERPAETTAVLGAFLAGLDARRPPPAAGAR
jgi:pimeloyl-ACP methyl ester carboxylesterase